MKLLSILFIMPFALLAQQPKAQISELAPSQTLVIKSENTKADIKALIESYRERVLKGESMDALCKAYSEDPGSASNGGRYDNVVKGMMVPEFEAVAFRLEPNAISEVFETKYGFHFIKLIAKKGDAVNLQHLLLLNK